MRPPSPCRASQPKVDRSSNYDVEILMVGIGEGVVPPVARDSRDVTADGFGYCFQEGNVAPFLLLLNRLGSHASLLYGEALKSFGHAPFWQRDEPQKGRAF